jgi:hypothetical protein
MGMILVPSLSSLQHIRQSTAYEDSEPETIVLWWGPRTGREGKRATWGVLALTASGAVHNRMFLYAVLKSRSELGSPLQKSSQFG